MKARVLLVILLILLILFIESCASVEPVVMLEPGAEEVIVSEDAPPEDEYTLVDEVRANSVTTCFRKYLPGSGEAMPGLLDLDALGLDPSRHRAKELPSLYDQALIQLQNLALSLETDYAKIEDIEEFYYLASLSDNPVYAQHGECRVTLTAALYRRN